MAIYKNTPPIVTNGLVLHLDAGSRQSYVSNTTTWNDLSGQGNTGTLTVSGSTATSASFNGDNLGYIQFTGGSTSGSYVSLGTPASLNIANFTVGAWAKSNSFTNYQNIIFKGAGVGQYGIITNSLGQWCIQPNTVFITTDPITLNTWNYFVGTYTGTQIIAYRNGIQKTRYTISQATTATAIAIGADIANSRYFNGSIAMVHIYNRSLSAQEINQNYNATKSRFGLR